MMFIFEGANTMLRLKWLHLALLQLWFVLCACKSESGTGAAAQPDGEYFSRLLQYRRARDEFFKNNEKSPIPAALRTSFTGLNYFPINPQLRFRVKLHPLAEPDTVDIMTTHGHDRKALRLGYFEFTYRGEVLRLYGYRFLDSPEKEQNHILVPFRDVTSGKVTYGGGRYLDLQENDSGWYILDFNLAYNPSCAYGNNEFVCPLPPPENHLPIPIMAGEKRWLADNRP